MFPTTSAMTRAVSDPSRLAEYTTQHAQSQKVPVIRTSDRREDHSKVLINGCRRFAGVSPSEQYRLGAKARSIPETETATTAGKTLTRVEKWQHDPLTCGAAASLREKKYIMA